MSIRSLWKSNADNPADNPAKEAVDKRAAESLALVDSLNQDDQLPDPEMAKQNFRRPQMYPPFLRRPRKSIGVRTSVQRDPPNRRTIESKNNIRFHQEDDLGMDGDERMLRVTAGHHVEYPLKGAGSAVGCYLRDEGGWCPDGDWGVGRMVSLLFT
jgi:hypothetical protein